MGANLEVFKFATYLFIPLFSMIHFGDPEWYEHHVRPYKEAIWPPYDETHKPPKTSPELHSELARLKEQRRGRRSLFSEEVESLSTAQPSPVPTRDITQTALPSNANRFDWATGERRLV